MGPHPEGDDRASLRPLSELRGAGSWLVHLSAERTLLTWVRAAITLMVLGFAVDRFGILLAGRGEIGAASARWSSWIGLALVATGVLASAVAGLYYRRFGSRLARPDRRPDAGLALAVGLALLLAVIGAILAAYLGAAAPG